MLSTFIASILVERSADRKYLALFFCFLFSQGTALSQSRTVQGIVQDTAAKPIDGVVLLLAAEKDTLVAQTDSIGGFLFRNVTARSFHITTLYLNTKASTPLIETDTSNSPFTIDPITLKTGNNLAEIIITTDPISIKEDTIQYKASAYKVRDGAVVEDVLKKLPGLEVDGKGNVTAQGKEVTKVRVNGKDFFGGDVLTATKNLPANAIDHIQVIDDYGERARLTKIKSGEPEKVINITTKQSFSKGIFGTVSAGAGTDDRWMVNGLLNRFQGEEQISLIGTRDNTSQAVGISDAGINTSKTIGLNYRNKLGKDLVLFGSYSFSQRENYTESTSLQQDFNPLNIRSTDRNSKSSSKRINNSVRVNLEYTLDSMNFLKLNSSLNMSNSHSSNKSLSYISRPEFMTRNAGNGKNDGQSASSHVSLIYNHKFRKQGRNFTFNTDIDFSGNDQDRYVYNDYLNVDSTLTDTITNLPTISTRKQEQNITDNNSNLTYSINLSYIEPLSKSLSLEGTYTRKNAANNNIRDVYDIDTITGEPVMNEGQTNHYRFSFTTNRYGLNLQKTTKKYNYVIGIVVQPSQLEGTIEGRNNNTNYRFINWMPNARFAYNFAKNNTLTMSYNGYSKEPGYAQLQPVVDSSNLTNIIIGNPNLKPEFSNRLNLNYNRFDKKSGRSLYGSISGDLTQGKIVNTVRNDAVGTGRITSYQNTDGFYSLSGNFGLTQPFLKKKLSLSAGASGNYSNNVAFTDGQKNTGSNWSIRPNLRFRLDITDKIDLELSSRYNYSRTTTKYATTDVATETKNLSFSIEGKHFFFKDWTLSYDYSKNFFYGYNVATNPNIINVYAEYRFLKNKIARVRLQGYDLLNENTGITRSVSGTTVTDSRSNRLGRYLLLTFHLKIQSFNGKGKK